MRGPVKPTVAYFCMEYGLASELPIYAGGLGILAGDFLKSAGDLRMPLVGIGLAWGEGYTRQTIGDSGQPEDHPVTLTRDPLVPVDVEVVVAIGGKDIPLRAYRVTGYGTATLYVLEPVEEEDRWITRRLYGGGTEDRIAQEIILGVGGVRMLQQLGLAPQVYHFNEGHAVFAGLELLRQHRDAGDSFDAAWASVRRHIVFTTHTPVAAGNESHGIELMMRLGANLGLTEAELKRIGGSPFNMTVAGLRLSRRANGVAQLHGETAREMWRNVTDAAPIIAITNGVHARTWQDARVRAATVPDKDPATRRAELWDAHQTMKGELCDLIAQRTGTRLDTGQLLIGFARRAAPYKRADLILGDPERLGALFERGLQLVFSGKAHPAHAAAKTIVVRLVEAARRWPGRVLFLENYDMALGAALTRGCDVWLNNPRRPLEASGTSGMKAAMNGVLNLSVLDGWWPEGCRHGETGWKIGDPVDGDLSERDGDVRDREALFQVLEREVMPRYYDDRDGWIGMMLASISMSSWRFSSDRMMEDYYAQLYPPGER